jgi:hypothetical protein
VLHDWQNRTGEWAAMVGILASAKQWPRFPVAHG